MKLTATHWIIKLLQFELSYKTLKLATVIYFALFFIAWVVCFYYLIHSAMTQKPVNVLHFGAGGIVVRGTNKVKSLKIIGKR